MNRYDFDDGLYESMRRNGYYSGNDYNQKEYDLESLAVYDDGIRLSVRVTNFSSDEDYIFNQMVA